MKSDRTCPSALPHPPSQDTLEPSHPPQTDSALLSCQAIVFCFFFFFPCCFNELNWFLEAFNASRSYCKVSCGKRWQGASSTALSSATNSDLSPKNTPRHNSSNLRPCHPTGRHQLLKHSKRFRCLCFSSSQLCLLANANLHLSPRSAPSSNIHQLPEVCPQLSGAKIALQIGHCCASRTKEKLSENLLFG